MVAMASTTGFDISYEHVTGDPILNVISFPSGKIQQFESSPRKKKGKRHTIIRKPTPTTCTNNYPNNSYPTSSRGLNNIIDHPQHHHHHHDIIIQENIHPKDNIEVLIRVRPKNNREKVKTAKNVLKIMQGNTLIFDPKEDKEEFYFHGVKQKVHDCIKRPNKDMNFSFDHVYGPKCTNVEIFDETFKSIVNHIICGFSCSVFAYGATGSGKTFTMLGSHENPGLTFLVAMELYRRISEMANEYESEVVVSYLEIYNETLRDLLRPSGILNIREDGLHGVNIPNLTTHRPKDPSEMLELLSSGNNARTQHPTDHNSESSRSHAVFQVSVTMRKRFTHICLNYNMAKAKLVMVDLAGSERGALGTNAEASRHREGANINKSLLALGNCINALADGKKHIPYRDSKLTRILKDSLGGNCKTVMIANLAPTNLTYDDTYNTLKYADRAKQIRVHCKKNITNEDNITGHHQHHDKIISDLQIEIHRLTTLLNETGCSTTKQSSLVTGAPAPAPLVKQHEPITTSYLGMGDGKKYLSSSNTSTIIGSPLISQTQVINDPIALENFIQLLGRKKKLDESLVKICVLSKEAEWKMKWKNWQIDAVNSFNSGNLDTNHNCINLEKLTCLRSQYDSLYINHEDCKEKVELAKRVFNFNRKEIELVSKNFLSTLKMDEPFLTVTLSEFLYYKSLEREVGSRKCIENYYQQMSTIIFDELLKSETILASSLNFLKYLQQKNNNKNLNSNSTSKKYFGNNKDDNNKYYNEILSKLYSDEPIQMIMIEKNARKKNNGEQEQEIDFPSLPSIQDLIHLIRQPVVEYESPVTVGDSQSAESEISVTTGGDTILKSLVIHHQNNLNIVASSSSLEYSTTSTTKEEEINDEQNWITNSDSTTSDVPINNNNNNNNSTTTTTGDIMKMLINSSKLCGGTTDSKSSAPFTDASETSLLHRCNLLKKNENKPKSKTLPRTTNKKITEQQQQHAPIRSCVSSRSTIIPPAEGSTKVSFKSEPQINESIIPLKNVPASTSICLKEILEARKDKHMKLNEGGTTGTDIVVLKPAPPQQQQQQQSNKTTTTTGTITTKDRSNNQMNFKTKFTKSCCKDMGGKQRQNFR